MRTNMWYLLLHPITYWSRRRDSYKPWECARFSPKLCRHRKKLNEIPPDVSREKCTATETPAASSVPVPDGLVEAILSYNVFPILIGLVMQLNAITFDATIGEKRFYEYAAIAGKVVA